MSTEISEFPSSPGPAEHAVVARSGLGTGDDRMVGGVVDVPSGLPARVRTPQPGECFTD